MLNKFVAVYVPGTQGLADKLENQASWVSAVGKKLAASFGGATATAGTGFYLATNGELVAEPVVVVRSYYDEIENAIEIALEIANWLKAELQQETVTVETNDGLQFV